MGIETCGEVNVMASAWPLCTKARTLIFLIHNIHNHLRHTTPTSAQEQNQIECLHFLFAKTNIKLYKTIYFSFNTDLNMKETP